MVLAVIPSRFQSSRFPGKALAPLLGVPLVVRVARRVREAAVADRVLVATDDARIAAAAEADGFPVRLATEPFRSGSDRVAAAAADSRAEVILNVQGDEPLLERAHLVAALAALGDRDLGTIAAPFPSLEEQGDADAVKVVVDAEGRARRFSREPLPGALLHLGVYAFRASALRRFAALPSTAGELEEGLEQLRALEHGMIIGVELTRACRAVNRPGDVKRVEALLRSSPQ